MEQLSRCAQHQSPSCPGLSRASTSLLTRSKKDVDGRDKPGHDEQIGQFRWNSFRALCTASEFVMPGLVPQAGCFRLGSSNRTQLGVAELLRIHVFTDSQQERRGWPGQARPW